MIGKIDKFFQEIEGEKTNTRKRKTAKKTLGAVATKRRKTTTATRAKKSIRKKASAAKKTATKRVKRVIDNFVKSANSSITKMLKPKRTTRKAVKKTITNVSFHNGTGEYRIYAKVNGVERSKKLLKPDAAKFGYNKKGVTAAQAKTLANKYFNKSTARRKKATLGSTVGSKYHKEQQLGNGKLATPAKKKKI